MGFFIELLVRNEGLGRKNCEASASLRKEEKMVWKRFIYFLQKECFVIKLVFALLAILLYYLFYTGFLSREAFIKIQSIADMQKETLVGSEGTCWDPRWCWELGELGTGLKGHF